MRPSELVSGRERLGRRRDREQREVPGYLRDSVLGAVDGTVTTFAVVAGAIGASLAPPIVLVLGMANLFADGLSMGVSNYLGIRADEQARAWARLEAEESIAQEPDIERAQLRAHYAQLGIPGEVLDGVVAGVTADRTSWVGAIMEARFGPPDSDDGALKAGLVTFLAFAVAGAIPLLTFVGDALGFHVGLDLFLLSTILTMTTFFAVGVIKGIVVGRPWLTDGLETLALGGAAAGLAFLVGWLLRGVAEGV